MTNDLALLRNTPPIPSLRRGLAALAGALNSTKHPGQATRYHLAAGLRLTDAMRAELTETRAVLQAAADPSSTLGLGSISPNDARVTLITAILAGFSVGSTTPEREDARFDNYEIALEDVPAWALIDARRRWVRKACPTWIEKVPNYNWAPAPATLRSLAFIPIDSLREDIDRCTKLLSCVSEKDALNPDQKPLPPPGKQPLLRRM